MKRNIGDIDAIVRIMAGFVLAYCFYIAVESIVWQSLGLILAGLLMLTAVHGTCPLYRILKISSVCKKCSTCKTCESTRCDADCGSSE